MSKQYFVGDFKTEYNGHMVIVRFNGAVPVFTTEELKTPARQGGYATPKEFATLEAICKAIDQYELELRKDFTNATAYRAVKKWGNQEPVTIEKVTITSLIDGNYCWLKKPDGGREKYPLQELYDDQNVLADHVKETKAIDGAAAKAHAASVARLAPFKWKPKKEGDK